VVVVWGEKREEESEKQPDKRARDTHARARTHTHTEREKKKPRLGIETRKLCETDVHVKISREGGGSNQQTQKR